MTQQLLDNVWVVLPVFGRLLFDVLLIFGLAALADAAHELFSPSDWREPWGYDWDEPFNMDEPADAKIFKFPR